MKHKRVHLLFLAEWGQLNTFSHQLNVWLSIFLYTSRYQCYYCFEKLVKKYHKISLNLVILILTINKRKFSVFSCLFFIKISPGISKYKFANIF